MQTMAEQLGGKVQGSDVQEFGYAQVTLEEENTLIGQTTDHVSEEGRRLLDVWMSHGDKVTEVPDNFEVIASSDNSPIAAMYDASRQFYGVQFHPESILTPQGKTLIKNWISI